MPQPHFWLPKLKKLTFFIQHTKAKFVCAHMKSEPKNFMDEIKIKKIKK